MVKMVFSRASDWDKTRRVVEFKTLRQLLYFIRKKTCGSVVIDYRPEGKECKWYILDYDDYIE